MAIKVSGLDNEPNIQFDGYYPFSFHSATYPSYPQKLQAKALSVEVTDDLVTVRGKCGAGYSMTVRQWKKFKKKIETELRIEEGVKDRVRKLGK